MTEKFISSLHVQKLGHEIQEIRERALFNISSKLDHGFVYDNDLARSKEILTKLFEWFLFDPCTKQELVFSLIKRILEVSDASQHREIRHLLRFD
jgi:rotatin